MLKALCFTLIAFTAVHCQAPSDSVIGRIVEAPVPARSVSGNLVPVPAGTTYYANNDAYKYEGEGAPENWCKTSQDVKCVCQSGRLQSPIDMGAAALNSNNITAEVLASPYNELLTPNYSTAAIVNVSNPGHGTPQINVAPDSPNNTIMFMNRTFELVQIHFHAAAEHVFNGTRADLEAHVVHKDPTTNGLAVFGFVFDKNGRTPDPLLAFTLDNMPNNSYVGPNDKKMWNTTRVGNPVDLQALLSPYFRGHFLYYQGSLTTPPCTEGVQWFFFPRLLSMTIRQLADFDEYKGQQFQGDDFIPENYRPAQPLNGRTVELY